MDQHDLIVARATAAGPGAIAIVRVDGNGTEALVRALFRAVGKSHPADAPREAILGEWIEPDKRRDAASTQRIDEGITIFFRGPHSFTGNDLAEFHCHGGGAIVRRLIAESMRLGARPAQPGEFTRRAFLNGRMDLAQAEAVADLVCAETEAAARAASAQLAGGLSREIAGLREALVTLAAEIEARIDFPDEGIEAADEARLTQAFDEIESGLRRLAATRERGRLLREGARVALVGPPNVGKSSLLNALARTDRAIVTPHPGTTRDTVECTIDLAGIPVTLIDTAGLRESDEPVEMIGIERTRRAIWEADCIIEVRDATGGIPPLPLNEFPEDSRRIIVENKSDLLPHKFDLLLNVAPASSPVERTCSSTQPGAAVPHSEKKAHSNVYSEDGPTRDLPMPALPLRISAATGAGIDQLERALGELIAGDSSETGESAIAVSARHAALLDQALAALAQARGGWSESLGGELIMIDLREALTSLDEILGLAPSEAILDRVFEKFCIGK